MRTRGRSNGRVSAGYALMAVCLLPAAAGTGEEGTIRLKDVTRETGITFRHTDGSSGRRYIVETVSAGLALFDYDGDGLVDIYFLNGAPLPGTPSPAGSAKDPPRNALYRNEGSFRFRDVTAEAGVGDTGYGLGVAVGDYDDDGDLDLYLNNFGASVLYRNNGNGTFTDVTRAAGLGRDSKVGAGACFLDIDGDRDLDLFAATYLEFSFEKNVATTTNGYPVYANPRFFRPVPNSLFRNNGEGTFTDVSKESGIAVHASWGMGAVCADYDGDGDTDIFVANDVSANFLFRNDGTGRFEEVGLLAGVAYDLQGDEQGSMGADFGDYDNDGRLDLYVTSYQGQLATLYRNLGGGLFEDVTLRTGAGEGTLPNVTWGAGFVDFDNDGFRDIFVACGHLQDNVDLFDDTTSYEEKNLLLRNTGDGRFMNVSEDSGDGLAVKLSSRGAGFDDLDNDGLMDVVILNSRKEPTILRNQSPGGNHWIEVELRGARTNRFGVGAKVKVVAGDLTQVDEVHAGRGYQSHYGGRLHFGLGKRARVDRIEVRWAGGATDVLRDVRIDAIRRIEEAAAR